MSPDASRAHEKSFEPIQPGELHGFFFEDLFVGQTAAFSKTITEVDVVMFAGISGDTNPLHLSEDFARQTMFGGRIAHGMLTGSLISTLIGTRLPGPGCAYMGQTLRFNAPVKLGDTVNTRATITALNEEKARAEMDTICMVGDEVVIEGAALVKVPVRNPRD
jgi:3-hydroxybutyryl-CoA dehydratase